MTSKSVSLQSLVGFDFDVLHVEVLVFVLDGHAKCTDPDFQQASVDGRASHFVGSFDVLESSSCFLKFPRRPRLSNYAPVAPPIQFSATRVI